MNTKHKQVLYKVVFNPPKNSAFFIQHPTADPNKYPVSVCNGFPNIKDATAFMNRVNGVTPAWYQVKEYSSDDK